MLIDREMMSQEDWSQFGAKHLIRFRSALLYPAELSGLLERFGNILRDTKRGT